MTQDQEAIYDAEIAPAIQAIANRCLELGMPFFAVAEYKPGDNGATYAVPDDAGISIQMIAMLSRSHGNIDRFFFNLARHLRSAGTDTSSSLVLNKLLKD